MRNFNVLKQKKINQMRIFLIFIILFTAVVGCSAPDSFIKTLSFKNSNEIIKVGMSKVAVKNILGKPGKVDKIHTTSLPTQSSRQEEWFYCSDDICSDILFILHFWNNNLRIIEKHNISGIKRDRNKVE